MLTLARKLYGSKSRTVVYGVGENGYSINQNKIAVSANGAVYLVASNSDYIVLFKIVNSSIAWGVKIGAYGTLVWGALYIQIDASENAYVLASNDGNLYLMKFNSSGVNLWKRKLYEYDAKANGICIGTDGSVYVAVSRRAGFRFLSIMKFNGSGTLQWKTEISGSSPNGLSNYGVAPICIAGSYLYAAIVDDNQNNHRLFSIDTATGSSFGNQVDITGTYAASVDKLALAADASNNIYLTETSYETANYISKYDSSLTLQWAKTFDYGINENGSSASVNGSLLTVFMDKYVLELDLSGNLQHSKMYNYGITGGQVNDTGIYASQYSVFFRSPTNWLGNGSSGSYSYADGGLSLSDASPTVSVSSYTLSPSPMTVSNYSSADSSAVSPQLTSIVLT